MLIKPALTTTDLSQMKSKLWVHTPSLWMTSILIVWINLKTSETSCSSMETIKCVGRNMVYTCWTSHKLNCSLSGVIHFWSCLQSTAELHSCSYSFLRAVHYEFIFLTIANSNTMFWSSCTLGCISPFSFHSSCRLLSAESSLGATRQDVMIYA